MKLLKKCERRAMNTRRNFNYNLDAIYKDIKKQEKEITAKSGFIKAEKS